MTRTLHFVAEAPPVEARRDVVTAVRRGFFGRCPRCGEGRMFRAYLKVADACPVCGEDLSHAARGRRARLCHDADHGAFHRRRHPRGGRTMAEFADLAARRRLVRARCSVFAMVVAASQGRAGRLSMGDADARLRRPGERVQLKPAGMEVRTAETCQAPVPMLKSWLNSAGERQGSVVCSLVGPLQIERRSARFSRVHACAKYSSLVAPHGSTFLSEKLPCASISLSPSCS